MRRSAALPAEPAAPPLMKVPRLLPPVVPGSCAAGDGCGVGVGVSGDCDPGTGDVIAWPPGALGATTRDAPGGGATLTPTEPVDVVTGESSSRPSDCRMQLVSSDAIAHRPMNKLVPGASCATAGIAYKTSTAASAVSPTLQSTCATTSRSTSRIGTGSAPCWPCLSAPIGSGRFRAFTAGGAEALRFDGQAIEREA